MQHPLNRHFRSTPRGTRTVAVLALAALLAVAVAGCGGSAKQPAPVAPTTQKVAGSGYSYTAPLGWKISTRPRGINATGPGSQLLAVAVYPLVKRFDPAKFAAAALELDKVAAQLATDRKGKVTASETITVAGIEVRSYRIEYTLDSDLVQQQVTFVLRGATEWLLVCRRAAADPDAPCAALLSSFTLAAAR